MQIVETEDVCSFPGMNAAACAEKAWSQVLHGPFAPMLGTLTEAELQKVRPAYFEEAIVMAEKWVDADGTSTPLTQMWVQATK